jgi:hypothetical protein
MGRNMETGNTGNMETGDMTNLDWPKLHRKAEASLDDLLALSIPVIAHLSEDEAFCELARAMIKHLNEPGPVEVQKGNILDIAMTLSAAVVRLRRSGMSFSA